MDAVAGPAIGGLLQSPSVSPFLQAATMAEVFSFQEAASPLGGLLAASDSYSSHSCFFSASLAVPEVTFFSRPSLWP